MKPRSNLDTEARVDAVYHTALICGLMNDFGCGLNVVLAHKIISLLRLPFVRRETLRALIDNILAEPYGDRADAALVAVQAYHVERALGLAHRDATEAAYRADCQGADAFMRYCGIDQLADLPVEIEIPALWRAP